MLGYCLEHIDEPHFQFVQWTVSSLELEAGHDEYVCLDACSVKNQTCLTHTSLLDQAFMWQNINS